MKSLTPLPKPVKNVILQSVKDYMYGTDYELIQACRQGNRIAWDRLLEKYQRLVYSIPLNYGLNADDAADIVQITFTILLQNLDNFYANTTLAPWLATVARRHSWRVIARQRREKVVQSESGQEMLHHLPDEETMPFQERWELIQWLEQGMAQLDNRCASLLQALYFSATPLSYEDVAQLLDMPVGSIGPTRARCLQRLRQILDTE